MGRKKNKLALAKALEKLREGLSQEEEDWEKEVSTATTRNENEQEPQYEEYVIVNGKKVNVDVVKLDLSNMDISSIDQIEGLERLTRLKRLYLEGNQLTEIKGLEKLTNLIELDLKNNQLTELKGLENLTLLKMLYLDNNQLTEIKGLETLTHLDALFLDNNQLTELKGLENLTRLDSLFLGDNPIPDIKGVIEGGYVDAQKAVKYCQSQINKPQKGLEREHIERKNVEKERFEIIKNQTTSFIKKSSVIYKELDFEKIAANTGIELTPLENLIGDMIYNKQINGHIHGNKVIFEKGTETQASLPTAQPVSTHPTFNTKNIDVSRGGDWKVEGDQSVFYYKVKVKNNSQLVVNNIQILLTTIPGGLTAEKDRHQITMLKPGSLESPTFKLMATESCVGDSVEGIVTYTDPTGTQQSIHIEPFEICYVCNLLTPKEISREDFDQKIELMEEKKIVIESDKTGAELRTFIEKKFSECNFALQKQLSESHQATIQKIEGFAEGLYDHQDVAMRAIIQEQGEGSRVILKALSDREDKTTDLLRDFNVKLDDIKSDTELIKEYTTQIEAIFDKQEDLEAYLKQKLSNDWQKIKGAYQDYKSGDITRMELIKRGLKVIGKKFIKKALGKVDI